MFDNLQEVRIAKELSVKVSGVDRFGNDFQQSATTVNVSRYGARLSGIACVNTGNTIEVSAGWFRKAKFRVVWAGAPGTPEASQVGIQALETKANLWEMDFPPPRLAPASVLKKKSLDQKKGKTPDTRPIPVKFDSAVAEPLSYERPAAFGGASDLVSLTFEHAPEQASVTRTTRTMLKDKRVPVTLRYKLGGANREEEKITAQVQGDGSCMVEVHDAIPQGTLVTIVNGYSNESRTGRVVMSSPPNPRGTHPVAIELEERDPAFWAAPPSATTGS